MGRGLSSLQWHMLHKAYAILRADWKRWGYTSRQRDVTPEELRGRDLGAERDPWALGATQRTRVCEDWYGHHPAYFMKTRAPHGNTTVRRIAPLH